MPIFCNIYKTMEIYLPKHYASSLHVWFGKTHFVAKLYVMQKFKQFRYHFLIQHPKILKKQIKWNKVSSSQAWIIRNQIFQVCLPQQLLE